MPTPIELLLDPVSLTVFAIYGALIIWEEVVGPQIAARTYSQDPLEGTFGGASG